MGGLPGEPESCPYGVEEDDVSQWTGLCPAGAGGTQGASGDHGPCPVNC